VLLQRLQTLFQETTHSIPLMCSCGDYRLCSIVVLLQGLRTLFHCCAPAETTEFVPLLCCCRNYRLYSKRPDCVPLLCCCRDYRLCSIVVLLQRLQTLFHCCVAAQNTDFVPMLYATHVSLMNNVSVSLHVRSFLCLHDPLFLLRMYEASQRVTSEYSGYSKVDHTIERC